MGGRLASQDGSGVKLLLVSSKDGVEWAQGGNPARPAPGLTVWCTQCELLVTREVVSEVTQLVAGTLSKYYMLDSLNCLPSTPGGLSP